MCRQYLYEGSLRSPSQRLQSPTIKRRSEAGPFQNFRQQPGDRVHRDDFATDHAERPESKGHTDRLQAGSRRGSNSLRRTDDCRVQPPDPVLEYVHQSGLRRSRPGGIARIDSRSWARWWCAGHALSQYRSGRGLQGQTLWMRKVVLQSGNRKFVCVFSDVAGAPEPQFFDQR